MVKILNSMKSQKIHLKYKRSEKDFLRRMSEIFQQAEEK